MALFDDKTKEELEAIAVTEAAEAEVAKKEADDAAEKARKEIAEAAAARAAADGALAKKVAAEAGTPVGSVDTRVQEAWVLHCRKQGWHSSKVRPEHWNPFA